MSNFGAIIITMVRQDITTFITSIPTAVTIVAATKYVGVEDMKKLYESGITNFGENRVDSFLDKYGLLKDLPVTWHFIGHLQRNKAKEVIGKIDYLHSLDSLELAKIIDERAQKPLKCFVEVSINLEETKNGVPFMELESFIGKVLNYKNIELVGLMMMAIKASEENSLNHQFESLRLLRDQMEKKFDIKLPYLSMGMSDDYLEAINQGATHVRLGRILYDIK